MNQLVGRTALVCGASKGIGRAVAELLAEQGAKVILLARDLASLEETKACLKDSTRHTIVAQNLNDLSGLKKMLTELLERDGDIGILVNNAGGPKSGPLLDADCSELSEAFQTHVLAAQTLTQALVPGMKRLKYGRIVNIISTSVKSPIPGLGVSNTVRGAMASWAKTMSHELGPAGITINNVLPGYTATERLSTLKEASAKRLNLTSDQIEKQWLSTIPLARFAEPREIAEAVSFLASPAAAYINGINLPVDGGRTTSL